MTKIIHISEIISFRIQLDRSERLPPLGSRQTFFEISIYTKRFTSYLICLVIRQSGELNHIHLLNFYFWSKRCDNDLFTLEIKIFGMFPSDTSIIHTTFISHKRPFLLLFISRTVICRGLTKHYFAEIFEVWACKQ